MKQVVLDASALLALFRGERGGDEVESVLDGALLSAVNLSEVIQKAEQHAVDTDGLEFDLEALGVDVVPFDAQQARLAADVWKEFPGLGLAMGDRACIGLALSVGGEAITADKQWSAVAHRVAVRLLR